jgi:hypothetical protein
MKISGCAFTVAYFGCMGVAGEMDVAVIPHP